MKKWLQNAALVALVAGGSLFWLACSGDIVVAQTNVLGPATTSASITVNGTLAALAANPSRKALTICNNDATNKVTITTGATSPVALTTGVVLLNGNVATSCITFGTPGGGASGGVGAAVNAIASVATVVVTFIEYF